ncbi:nucleotidyltransferase domain-containing protein [Novosphingobium sp.]|uniref:nucleotidyltransferase domain-containing protein n=1 Tax=Novosphingobium sp. TaxID=1874826 RepID=UPI00261C470D|nr:nucleotidyltransferase domain-containing protein [Novosphingobium sp.]
MKPAPDHGLSAATLAEIARVLSAFPEVERAILFGSRAKGVQRPGSDIDLALVGPAIDWRVVGRIEDAFDASSLPYRFSLLHRNADTPAEVGAHIARVGREIFVAPDAAEKTEARLAQLWTKGAKAWADVPDAGAWVEEQRGG